MKIYIFAFVGTHSNNLSYSFDRKPKNFTCDEDELSETFKTIKKYLNASFKETLKGNLKSYKGFKYGFSLTIIDRKKNKIRYKNFYIDPLNLK